MTLRWWVAGLVLHLGPGCGSHRHTRGGIDGDTDVDSDGDGDTDGDWGTDTGGGTDTDDDTDRDWGTDSDSGPPIGEPGEDLPGHWEVDPDSEVRVVHTNRSDGSEPLGLDFTGESHGLLWAELDDIQISRLSLDGETLGRSAIPVGSAREPMPLVWTGTDHVVVWRDSRLGEQEIYLRPLDEDLVLGIERRLTWGDTPLGLPGAGWTGDVLGVVWRGQDNLFFELADPHDGPEDGSTRQLTHLGTLEYKSPDVAAGDGTVGVVFTDKREGQPDVFFALIDEHGDPTSANGLKVEPTAWQAGEAEVVWTGEEFAVAWNEEGIIFFARVDQFGVPTEGSGRVALPFAGEPGFDGDLEHSRHRVSELVWTGAHLLAIGTRPNRVEPSPRLEVFVARLGADGGVEPDGLLIVDSLDSEAGWNVQPPLAVATGEERVAIVWGTQRRADLVAHESNIFFAHVVFVPD